MRRFLIGSGLVALALVLLSIAAEGCALHNPVPVQPDYPPSPPMAARDGGVDG